MTVKILKEERRNETSGKTDHNNVSGAEKVVSQLVGPVQARCGHTHYEAMANKAVTKDWKHKNNSYCQFTNTSINVTHLLDFRKSPSFLCYYRLIQRW